MREFMRRSRQTALVAVAFAAPLAAFAGLALAPGDAAPSLAGKKLSGELVGVAYDRITIVNFWASWCEPCIREMPALEGLHRNWSDKGLQVVGVAHERIAAADLADFVRQMGVTYTILMSRRRTSGDWGGLATLPVSFLIDSKGTILRRYVGAAPEQVDAMLYDVEAVMSGRPLGPMPIPAEPDVARPADRAKSDPS